jgi:hypothetical protein
MRDVPAIASAIATATTAISRAATRDPVAQRIAASSRAARRATRRTPRGLRAVQAATKRLAAADEADDVPGMVAAILDLSSLGIDVDAIDAAHAAAVRLSND